MANDKKKEVKVRDLKPSKDAKGGGGHTQNAMGGTTSGMGGTTSGMGAGNNKLSKDLGVGGKGS